MALSAEDQNQIGNVVVRYADAVSRCDAAQWADTWAGDSLWHLRSRTVAGREAIVRAWKEFLPAYQSIVQLVSQGWVEETADGPRGRWLILEIFRRAGEHDDAMQLTCYTDRYVRENGRWLFAERRLVVHYTRHLDAGEFYPWGPETASRA